MQTCAIFLLAVLPGIFTISNIFSRNEKADLSSAAVNIINACFGAPETGRSILLSEDLPIVIYQQVYDSFNFSVFTVRRRDSGFIGIESPAELILKHYGNYLKIQGKPNAVVMSVDQVHDLEFILDHMKSIAWTTWKTRMRFLVIVPKSMCNVAACNEVFKVIWNHWILNTVILCSSRNAEQSLKSDGIKLYTYNPYSSDHPQPWRIVFQETINVSLKPKNFSHSWYVYGQEFTEMKSLEDCKDLYFDKTLNLDGYVIPISMFIIRPQILLDETKSGVEKFIGVDGSTLQALAKKLRFDVVEVHNNDTDRYGKLLENGSYIGELKDLFYGLSHVVVDMHHLRNLPGLEPTYPHTSTGICFASRITGFYPQWMNIIVAKQIWIGVGLITLLLTVIFYLHNKSQGILSAFLDAERFVIGNSITRLPESVRHRLTFGIIFLAFIVLDAVFRGRFITILAFARQYPNLDTVEHVKEHGVEFYGFGPLRYLIDDPLLGEDYHELLPEECLASIKRDGKQRACLAHCLTLPSMMVNSTIIHRASEPIISDYATFISTLNWPMTDRWNFDIQKLVEAGIVEKWRLDFDRVMEIKSWKTKRMIEPPHVEPVAINTLLSAFVILILGLLIALVTFAWEMKTKCHSYHKYCSDVSVVPVQCQSSMH